MIDVTNRHIAVIGAARSGLAAAALLKKQGADVFVSDSSVIHSEARRTLQLDDIQWEEGEHSEQARLVDMAVVSPGVPDQTPLMKYYFSEGIPVYSEIEVASWFNRSPVIAVTGSNGKTTVTSWLEHVWKTAGKRCIAAGNIGRAFSDVIHQTEPETAVILEVSSFQLDHIRHFRPSVGVILNITPDHLDRYEHQFENYAASKLRIAENQQKEDVLIYNSDDPVLSEKVEKIRHRDSPPRILACSTSQEVEYGAFVRDQSIFLKLNENEELLMPTGDVGLPGRHNLNNGLATALAARVSEIKSESIRESLRTFTGVEHRLELVRECRGVRYVNDSKATNINAVWFALDSFRMPVILILGGRDKGNNYLDLLDQIREKVHTIIAIGEARPIIREQLEEHVPHFYEAASLEEAVKLGDRQSKRGEIVLLSPACSSFDMFDSYEHRGEIFKKAVQKLHE